MSSRVNTLLEHIKLSSPTSANPHDDVKRAAIMASLRAQFIPSKERLLEMSQFLLHEMHEGLQPGHESTLKMLPSYVYKRSPQKSNGVVYALDLGGSNFRVIRLTVTDGAVAETQWKKFTIPEVIIKEGVAGQLFDFIAGSIEDFLGVFSRVEEKNQPLRLGFTFSFPVQQHSIASGSLIAWTKEFKTRGVVGKDVVVLLREALGRKKIAFRVVALCNDTVGTLITRYFADETTTVGVILGTGSNACYFEKSSEITKCPEAQSQRSENSEMVVNMEFGGFDSKHLLVLPVTRFDNEIEAESASKGQRFEKMISGRYLGEVTRRILTYLCNMHLLPKDIASRLGEAYAFKSEYVGHIVSDHHPGLWETFHILKKHFGVAVTDESHRRLIQETCQLVSTRAAMLAGMAVATILLKTNKQYDASVAVDGSVFEKQPYFKSTMDRTIRMILGNGDGVRLILTRDGSGIGAGCIAALQQ